MSALPEPLAGRVAIVTGAGSLPGRGIGREVVANLAAKGARVLAADIDAATARNTADWCTAQGWDVRPLRVDVTRREDVASMVTTALDWFGRIDVLVNHAGRGSFLSLTETDDAHWDEMVALNLSAAFVASRAAVRHMLASGTGGVVLNTISSAGLAGGRGGFAYTAAKHGLVGLTRSVAATYGHMGIRCVGVAPGYVRSPRADAGELDAASYYGETDASRLFSGMAKLAARAGAPRQLADVIGFLATDEASFINGAIIAVDGGFTAI